MPEIKIVENTSELGAGTRGAGLGIAALQVVARQRNENFFGNYERFFVENHNDMLDFPTIYKYAKRIDGLAEVFQDTADIVSFVLGNNDFPLVLSGDHSCAVGTIAGIKKAYPNKTLGVIWIDAHADLHTPYTTPSGNVHGMPLALVLGENNMPCAANIPNKDVVIIWDELKEIGGKSPKLKPENLVFVAVRDTEAAEDEYIARNQVKNFSVDEFRAKGLQKVVTEIETKLAQCDLIYVSFDVDSMDCNLVSNGTGTPSANGLTPAEAQQLVCELMALEKTCCLEMVEINPCLDDKINKMAEVAFDILSESAKQIEKKIK